MDSGYRLVISGVQPGRTEEDVAVALAQQLKHPAEQLVPVLKARRAVNLNVTGAPLQVARALKEKYEGLGAACMLESLAPLPPQAAPLPGDFGVLPLRAFVNPEVGLALDAPEDWRDDSDEGLLRISHTGTKTWYTASFNRGPGVDLGVWAEIRFGVVAEKMAYLQPFRPPYSITTPAGPAIAAEFRGLVPGDAEPTHQLIVCLRPMAGAVSMSFTSTIADFEKHQALYLWLLRNRLRLHNGGAAPLPVHPHPQAQHDAGVKLAKRGQHREAAEYFRKAAEQGLAGAQFDLAVRHRLGQGVPQDMVQSFNWLRKAAQQGHRTAQYNLALMYGMGQGTAEDLAQAFYWMRKAAEQGDADAQHKLALSYIHGHGVPKDLAQAGQWALKAAEQGHPEAQFYAGVMHENGEGLPQDTPRALAWYRKAAAGKHAKAAERLKGLGG
jgi:TPR repeat protein